MLSSRCHDANRTKNSNRKTLDKMKIILKYIENHYMDKITIAEIASEVQFSESHFMRYFKETMGTTFTDYLKDYRLTMAARLLTTSDSTVLAIAEETGFENLSYFNRSFKKKYALTPRQFRNNLKYIKSRKQHRNHKGSDNVADVVYTGDHTYDRNPDRTDYKRCSDPGHPRYSKKCECDDRC